MDGFRWDYFDNIDMPGFADMAKDGVKAEYIVPDYPSISYPNYYSIMTGMITVFTVFPLFSPLCEDMYSARDMVTFHK